MSVVSTGFDGDTLAAAVIASSEAGTSRGARAEATEYVAAFQEALPGALETALGLLGHEDARVRHFALGAMEQAVRFGWPEFEEAQHASLMGLALELACDESLEGQPRFVREKICDMIVQIAMYAWPQAWPGLFESLQGSATRETVFVVWRSLAEKIGMMMRLDVSVATTVRNEHISQSRSRQLRTSLALEGPGMVEVLVGTLTETLGVLEAQGSESEAAFARQCAVVQTGAHVLRALFEYHPVTKTMAPGVPMVFGVLCGMLGFPDVYVPEPLAPGEVSLVSFRRTAVDALSVFFEHGHGECVPVVLGLFDHVGSLFDALEASMGAMGEASGDNRALSIELGFQQRLVSLLVSLGLFALNAFRRGSYSTTTSAELHPHFGEYLNRCLAVAAGHPSLEIQDQLSPLWFEFVRAQVMPQEALAEAHQSLLELAAQLVCTPNPLFAVEAAAARGEAASPGDAAAAALACLDFESEAQLKKGVRRVHKRGQAVIRSLAKCVPMLVLSFASQFVSYVYTDVLSGVVYEPGKLHTNRTHEWQMLNAGGLVLDAVLSSLPPVLLGVEVSTQATDAKLMDALAGDPARAQAQAAAWEHERGQAAEVQELVAGLFDGVMDYKSPSPHLMTRQISALEPFSTYFGRVRGDEDMARLGRVMTEIFDLVTYVMPKEAEAGTGLEALCGTTMALRGRACAALKGFARRCGNQLCGMLPQLWEHFQGLCEGGRLRRTEVAIIYEVLMLIVDQSADPDLVANFVATLTEPLRREWFDGATQAILTDLETFVGAVGLDGSGVSADGQMPFAERNVAAREQLSYLLTVLQIVTHSAGVSNNAQLAQSLHDFLPGLMSFVNLLNLLWSPHVQEAIPEAFGACFAPRSSDDPELQREVMAGAISLTLDAESQLDTVGWWLTRVHTMAIHVISNSMCSLAFYEVPGIPDTLTGTLFANLEHVPLLIATSYTESIMSTLRRRCPDHLKEAIFFPLVAPFLGYFQERLAGEWEQFQSREARGAAGEDDRRPQQESEDIELENALRLATVAFANYLRTMSFRISAATPENQAAGVEAPICAQFMMQGDMPGLLCGATISLLSWPVMDAQLVAVLVVDRMLNAFPIADPEFAQTAVHQLFPGVLAVLAAVHGDSSVRRVIDCLIKIYVLVGSTPQAAHLLPALQETLLQCPGVTEQGVLECHAVLADASATATQRQKAGALQRLLVSVVGAGLASARYKKGLSVVGDVINR